MLLTEALVGDKVYTGTHLEWVITNGSISDISLIKSISVFFLDGNFSFRFYAINFLLHVLIPLSVSLFKV